MSAAVISVDSDHTTTLLVERVASTFPNFVASYPRCVFVGGGNTGKSATCFRILFNLLNSKYDNEAMTSLLSQILRTLSSERTIRPTTVRLESSGDQQDLTITWTQASNHQSSSTPSFLFKLLHDSDGLFQQFLQQIHQDCYSTEVSREAEQLLIITAPGLPSLTFTDLPRLVYADYHQEKIPTRVQKYLKEPDTVLIAVESARIEDLENSIIRPLLEHFQCSELKNLIVVLTKCDLITLNELTTKVKELKDTYDCKRVVGVINNTNKGRLPCSSSASSTAIASAVGEKAFHTLLQYIDRIYITSTIKHPELLCSNISDLIGENEEKLRSEAAPDASYYAVIATINAARKTTITGTSSGCSATTAATTATAVVATAGDDEGASAFAKVLLPLLQSKWQQSLDAKLVHLCPPPTQVENEISIIKQCIGEQELQLFQSSDITTRKAALDRMTDKHRELMKSRVFAACEEAMSECFSTQHNSFHRFDRFQKLRNASTTKMRQLLDHDLSAEVFNESDLGRYVELSNRANALMPCVDPIAVLLQVQMLIMTDILRRFGGFFNKAPHRLFEESAEFIDRRQQLINEWRRLQNQSEVIQIIEKMRIQSDDELEVPIVASLNTSERLFKLWQRNAGVVDADTVTDVASCNSTDDAIGIAAIAAAVDATDDATASAGDPTDDDLADTGTSALVSALVSASDSGATSDVTSLTVEAARDLLKKYSEQEDLKKLTHDEYVELAKYLRQQLAARVEYRFILSDKLDDAHILRLVNDVRHIFWCSADEAISRLTIALNPSFMLRSVAQILKQQKNNDLTDEAFHDEVMKLINSNRSLWRDRIRSAQKALLNRISIRNELVNATTAAASAAEGNEELTLCDSLELLPSQTQLQKLVLQFVLRAPSAECDVADTRKRKRRQTPQLSNLQLQLKQQKRFQLPQPHQQQADNSNDSDEGSSLQSISGDESSNSRINDATSPVVNIASALVTDVPASALASVATDAARDILKKYSELQKWHKLSPDEYAELVESLRLLLRQNQSSKATTDYRYLLTGKSAVAISHLVNDVERIVSGDAAISRLTIALNPSFMLQSVAELLMQQGADRMTDEAFHKEVINRVNAKRANWKNHIVSATKAPFNRVIVGDALDDATTAAAATFTTTTSEELTLCDSLELLPSQTQLQKLVLQFVLRAPSAECDTAVADTRKRKQTPQQSNLQLQLKQQKRPKKLQMRQANSLDDEGPDPHVADDFEEYSDDSRPFAGT